MTETTLGQALFIAGAALGLGPTLAVIVYIEAWLMTLSTLTGVLALGPVLLAMIIVFVAGTLGTGVVSGKLGDMVTKGLK
jgi:hypothetical protein